MVHGAKRRQQRREGVVELPRTADENVQRPGLRLGTAAEHRRVEQPGALRQRGGELVNRGRSDRGHLDQGLRRDPCGDLPQGLGVRDHGDRDLGGAGRLRRRRGHARKALGPGGRPVPDDHLVAGVKQPPRDPAPHRPEPDHCNLHAEEPRGPGRLVRNCCA